MVKVVSRCQATHEVRVLETVGARKGARAVQVLAQIRINRGDGDVGLVTPYCPGKLFEGAATLYHVLHQAVQLCEVRWTHSRVARLPLQSVCTVAVRAC